MGDERRWDWKSYAWAIGVNALATLVGWPLYHGLNAPNNAAEPIVADTNVLMLYLLGVVWVASRCSRSAAILASVLAVAAFDFCFTKPYLTFTVNDRQYIFTFAVMLFTALTICTLTHRVRQHAMAAREAWERAEAEFLRNTLLSGVSHDLRTPLAVITGIAKSLIDTSNKLPFQAQHEMLDTIYTESERMERLVNNLLEMTRLESGGLQLKRDWQHLHDTVGATLRNLDKRLGGREIQTSIPSDLPLVWIDDVAIGQVLANLIDNAVDHAPEDSTIELCASAADGQVIIEVRDRGPGLPAGAEGRLFEKFFRARPARERSYRGIGLGLAICKALVEAHGGTISADNRPGGGAVFRFSLPLLAPPSQEVEPADSLIQTR